MCLVIDPRAVATVLGQVWNVWKHILTLNLNLWVGGMFGWLFGLKQRISEKPVGILANFPIFQFSKKIIFWPKTKLCIVFSYRSPGCCDCFGTSLERMKTHFDSQFEFVSRRHVWMAFWPEAKNFWQTCWNFS